jgi:malate dehydrogenase
VTWTADARRALDGASYLISSGGAPRREGMTREDLLRGNAEIAAQLGKEIRTHCPRAKLVVIIFNPADVTGLVTQVHSGLAPGRVATLAALDSTRLQSALAQHFDLPQDAITGCRTYGGHGEMMAVFASTAKVSGRPLADLIGTPALTAEAWAAIQERVRQGGKRIIELRGRSSFQSPAHHAVLMVKAAIDGKGFEKIVMGMETRLDGTGVHWEMPRGTEAEIAALRASYEHLVKLRDETIAMGVLPPLGEWRRVNPNLA